MLLGILANENPKDIVSALSPGFFSLNYCINAAWLRRRSICGSAEVFQKFRLYIIGPHQVLEPGNKYRITMKVVSKENLKEP